MDVVSNLNFDVMKLGLKMGCSSVGAKVGWATINQQGAIEGWPGLVRNCKHLPALSDRDFFCSAAGPVN